jgi:hypothetical protein
MRLSRTKVAWRIIVTAGPVKLELLASANVTDGKRTGA